MPNRVEGDSSYGQNEKSSCGEDGSLAEKSSKHGVVDYLETLLNHPLIITFFESRLEEEGLLSVLEEKGIVPVVENPNPFDVEEEAAQHENWWENHPNEGDEFGETIEKRELTLRNLFVGYFLGSKHPTSLKKGGSRFEKEG